MTIDIMTALDQAFFQAETAQNEQVRKHAIQHFINVAGMLEEALEHQVGARIERRVDASGEQPSSWPTGTVDLSSTPPAPDAIDMADPRNWQAGDVLRCEQDFLTWKKGDEGKVIYADEHGVKISGRIAGQLVVWLHSNYSPVQEYFTWLRHGDVPTQA